MIYFLEYLADFNCDNGANRSPCMRITQTLLLDTLLLDSLLEDSLFLDTLAARAPIQRKIERAKNQSYFRIFL